MPNNIDRGTGSNNENAKFVTRIEAIHAEMESAKGSYMQKCAQFREEIKAIEGEAKDNGVPKKAVRGMVKFRQLTAKREALLEELEDDQLASFKSIGEALGAFADTGLGAAAVARETEDKNKQDPTTAAIVGAVAQDEDKKADKPKRAAPKKAETKKAEDKAADSDTDEEEKAAEQAKIAEQRAQDEKAFDEPDAKAEPKKSEAAKSAGANGIDPKAARANRSAPKDASKKEKPQEEAIRF